MYNMHDVEHTTSYSLPSPTELYCLPPIGVGTQFVESLTSYIARLADAHCVSTGSLISKAIIPRLNKPYLNKLAESGGTRIYHRSHALNGVGDMAKSWSAALGALTGSCELTYLTWFRWAGTIPSRELLKQKRCWCPKCFNDQLGGGQPVYEPLLWTAKCLNYCAIHDGKLIDTCPHCGRQMAFLERQTSPGRCSKCNSWLGENLHRVGDMHDVQHSASHELGQLLAGQIEVSGSHWSIPDALTLLVNTYHDGNVAAAARHLGVPKVTFWGWTHGQNLPTLGQALHISATFNIKLVDFLFGKVASKSFLDKYGVAEIRPAISERRKQRTLDLNSLERDLKSFVQLQPQSLRQIAKNLGVDERTLRSHFPELCERLSGRMQNFVQNRSQARKDSLANRVRQATIELHKNSIYPSRRRVEAFIKSPGVLREQSAKIAWHDTLSAIGIPFDKTSYQIDKTSN